MEARKVPGRILALRTEGIKKKFEKFKIAEALDELISDILKKLSIGGKDPRI